MFGNEILTRCFSCLFAYGVGPMFHAECPVVPCPGDLVPREPTTREDNTFTVVMAIVVLLLAILLIAVLVVLIKEEYRNKLFKGLRILQGKPVEVRYVDLGVRNPRSPIYSKNVYANYMDDDSSLDLEVKTVTRRDSEEASTASLEKSSLSKSFRSVDRYNSITNENGMKEKLVMQEINIERLMKQHENNPSKKPPSRKSKVCPESNLSRKTSRGSAVVRKGSNMPSTNMNDFQKSTKETSFITKPEVCVESRFNSTETPELDVVCKSVQKDPSYHPSRKHSTRSYVSEATVGSTCYINPLHDDIVKDTEPQDNPHDLPQRSSGAVFEKLPGHGEEPEPRVVTRNPHDRKRSNGSRRRGQSRRHSNNSKVEPRPRRLLPVLPPQSNITSTSMMVPSRRRLLPTPIGKSGSVVPIEEIEKTPRPTRLKAWEGFEKGPTEQK